MSFNTDCLWSAVFSKLRDRVCSGWANLNADCCTNEYGNPDSYCNPHGDPNTHANHGTTFILPHGVRDRYRYTWANRDTDSSRWNSDPNTPSNMPSKNLSELCARSGHHRSQSIT